MENRIAFNDRAVAALPFVAKGQTLVRDADLPGFFIKVGTKTKSYMVQGDLWIDNKRQSIAVKIGEVGRLPAREARAKAKVVLASIADGVDPRPKPEVPLPAPAVQRAEPTLREAWASYRESHMRRKGRSEGTIANYADHVERLMTDWLDDQLSSLGNDPALVKKRHDELTEANGPYIANGAMRSLRAIYNHARKAARTLPADNPVMAVDWNVEHRAKPAWV